MHTVFFAAGRMRRSPYGERGLKSSMARVRVTIVNRRSPYGERGLKFRPVRNAQTSICRSPYGERGLKSSLGGAGHVAAEGSLSLRRAWIEIDSDSAWSGGSQSRSPYGERGLKLSNSLTVNRTVTSLSLRRAWIEIVRCALPLHVVEVALLTESVD